MTPYFIAPPLPGRGIDIVVRKFEKKDFQYGGNFKKNNVSIRLVKTNGTYVISICLLHIQSDSYKIRIS